MNFTDMLVNLFGAPIVVGLLLWAGKALYDWRTERKLRKERAKMVQAWIWHKNTEKPDSPYQMHPGWLPSGQVPRVVRPTKKLVDSDVNQAATIMGFPYNRLSENDLSASDSLLVMAAQREMTPPSEPMTPSEPPAPVPNYGGGDSGGAGATYSYADSSPSYSSDSSSSYSPCDSGSSYDSGSSSFDSGSSCSFD
jgi:hypothetical protein